MADIKAGDRVRIRDQKDWPTPPGFVMARAEGTVKKWVEYDESMEDFPNYVLVHVEKAEGPANVYIGNDMCFLADDLEKI